MLPYEQAVPAACCIGYDTGALLTAKGYDPVRMVRAGEAFYSSLGFAPLPATFWTRSQITKPRDREVVCHASAWDIDNRDDLAVIASDNISVSAAFCGAKIAEAPDLMTFTPDALELLRCCIMYGDDVCQLTFNEKGCNVSTGPLRATIKQVPPLKHDLRAIVDAYSSSDVISPIPRDRIAAFIKRAAAIAEAKRMAVVTLGGSEGRLTLSFEEGSASSEEYYLVEDVKIPDIAPLQIDSARLARALAYIDHVVLDHADRSVLVLQNIPASDDDVLFSYLLVGKK